MLPPARLSSKFLQECNNNRSKNGLNFYIAQFINPNSVCGACIVILNVFVYYTMAEGGINASSKGKTQTTGETKDLIEASSATKEVAAEGKEGSKLLLCPHLFKPA